MYRVVFILCSMFAFGLFQPKTAFAQKEERPTSPKQFNFPPGFLWGVATSGHQIEGDNVNSDWWHYEQDPTKIRDGQTSGKACDHCNRVEEDISLLKSLRVDVYRMSIEWSRIEPSPGVYDPKWLDYYAREIDLLLKSGIEPIVTLNHFTLPKWVADKGSWEWTGISEAFEKFTEVVYQRIGPKVNIWVTLNEPNVVVALGYLGFIEDTEFPPGKKNVDSAIAAMRNMLRAHAKAYWKIDQLSKLDLQMGARERVASVGIAYHLRVFDPRNKYNPLDQIMAKVVDPFFNWAFADAVETGEFKALIADRRLWPIRRVSEKIEGLKGTQDFFGINYYTRDFAHLKLKPKKHEVELTEVRKSSKDITDTKWEIYPKGIYRLSHRVHQKYSRLPILITETGLADRKMKDTKRIAFLKDHLAFIHKAISEKVPIFGVVFWSLYDNFEWVLGFKPKFGLFHVNRKTMERTSRVSASVFADIAAKNGLVMRPPRNFVDPPGKVGFGGRFTKEVGIGFARSTAGLWGSDLAWGLIDHDPTNFLKMAAHTFTAENFLNNGLFASATGLQQGAIELIPNRHAIRRYTAKYGLAMYGAFFLSAAVQEGLKTGEWKKSFQAYLHPESSTVMGVQASSFLLARTPATILKGLVQLKKEGDSLSKVAKALPKIRKLILAAETATALQAASGIGVGSAILEESVLFFLAQGFNRVVVPRIERGFAEGKIQKGIENVQRTLFARNQPELKNKLDELWEVYRSWEQSGILRTFMERKEEFDLKIKIIQETTSMALSILQGHLEIEFEARKINADPYSSGFTSYSEIEPVITALAWVDEVRRKRQGVEEIDRRSFEMTLDAHKKFSKNADPHLIKAFGFDDESKRKSDLSKKMVPETLYESTQAKIKLVKTFRQKSAADSVLLKELNTQIAALEFLQEKQQDAYLRLTSL